MYNYMFSDSSFNIDDVIYWDELYNFGVSFVTFLAFLEMLKPFAFIPWMSTLQAILIKSLPMVFHFAVAFSGIFIAFGSAFYLAKGPWSAAFSSFSRAVSSQLSILLGLLKFSANILDESKVSKFFFVSFVMMNIFLIMNMFISVITDALEEVKGQNQKRQ